MHASNPETIYSAGSGDWTQAQLITGALHQWATETSKCFILAVKKLTNDYSTPCLTLPPTLSPSSLHPKTVQLLSDWDQHPPTPVLSLELNTSHLHPVLASTLSTILFPATPTAPRFRLSSLFDKVHCIFYLFYSLLYWTLQCTVYYKC